MNRFLNQIKEIFFKEDIIKIPLTKNGILTGQWVECKKGDDTYIKLIKIYGYPLPKEIEVIPYNKDTE